MFAGDKHDPVLLEAARSRRIIVAAVVAAQLHGGGQGPQGAKRRDASPFHWPTHEALFSEAEFKLRYRVPCVHFHNLCNLLRKHLQVSDEMRAANAKNGQLIDCETRLACGLRYLAGGQVLDLRVIYHLFSRSTVYDIAWTVVDAVNCTLKIEFPLSNVGRLQQLEMDFAATFTMHKPGR